jgi:hypothetical protein
VHTLYGQQMGGRKSYNPKNKGKKSYQPMLTFIAETREYIWGGLRNGDRPTGKQIGDHIRDVCAALPPCVKQIYGRADSGFHCRQAVEAYEKCAARFVISARKTSRLVEQLRQAEWKPWKKTFFTPQVPTDRKLPGASEIILEIPQGMQKDFPAICPVQFDADISYFGQP